MDDAYLEVAKVRKDAAEGRVDDGCAGALRDGGLDGLGLVADGGVGAGAVGANHRPLQRASSLSDINETSDGTRKV